MKLWTPNRRTMLKATGAAVAAPYLIRPRDAVAAGEVNVWTYDNFLPEDFVAAFERDTGIRVNQRFVNDQGQQFNLLAAEAPEPTVDVVTVAGHRFRQFIDSDLLAPLDTSRLANWTNIKPVFRESAWMTVEGNLWGAPILMGSEGLTYNTNYVGAEEADSWAVMFDEKYEGRTAYIIQDFMSCVLLYLGYDGNMIEYLDNRQQAVEAVNHVRDFLIEHKDMVRKYYESGAEVQQMFINEDIVLAQTWSGPAAKLIFDGFPVRYTIPKEGSFAFVYTLNVTNNGPNPDNAYRLLDALFAESEHGTAMTKASGFASTMVGAEEGLSELERRATSPSDEELERLVFFRAEANELKYDLLDRAVEEVKAA
jgi:spermidine/putrescine transport system substrate-binding protein